MGEAEFGDSERNPGEQRGSFTMIADCGADWGGVRARLGNGIEGRVGKPVGGRGKRRSPLNVTGCNRWKGRGAGSLDPARSSVNAVQMFGHASFIFSPN